jgi:hypothetical protein
MMFSEVNYLFFLSLVLMGWGEGACELSTSRILATSVVGQTVVCSEAETNARGSAISINILQGESGMVCTGKQMPRLLMHKRAVSENEYKEETGIAVLVRRGENIAGMTQKCHGGRQMNGCRPLEEEWGEKVSSDTIVWTGG